MQSDYLELPDSQGSMPERIDDLPNNSPVGSPIAVAILRIQA
jgi:hypothetical protein